MDLTDILIRVPAFLLGIGLHEWAHAFVADRAGDPTPRQQGRLTLNPLNHLDPLGTLCILVAPFGWGRPVQVTPRQMDDPERDHVRVSLAGPLTNLWLASAGLVVLDLLSRAPQLASRGGVLLGMVQMIVTLNLILALFNLIPVPPLDGSRFAAYHGGPAWRRRIQQLEPYGMLLVLVLVMSGVLHPLFRGGYRAMGMLFQLGLGAEVAVLVGMTVLWTWNAGMLRGRGGRTVRRR